MKPLSSILVLAMLCLCTSIQSQSPLNDIVHRRMLSERPVLKPAPMREADIFWEKRISRVIDVQQKQNLPFMYPAAPFFNILKAGAEAGQIKLYTSADFQTELSSLEGVFFETDTIVLYTEDYIENITVVRNDIGYEEIKKFRLTELWYFDESTSTLKVQILGIAPIKSRTNDLGEAMYDQPLFWIHFPSARDFLATQNTANNFNDAALTSWDDLFQLRQFASHITKQSNVRDNRLQDMYSGVQLLEEADKIKQEIQNFEHDLWSY